MEPQPSNDELHLQTLKKLAEGINPLTGQPFPDDHVYQHAKFLRALQSAIEAMERKIKRQARQKDLPQRTGEAWSKSEDEALTQSFSDKVPVQQIAKKHQRTPGAITSRLVKLGLMADPHQPVTANA